ncbi:syntaxin binding protein 1 [Coemansia sp. IMI 203386]|nr:syntaxin binding protein 1 [Coemansia sp. IMI 203386]
MDTRAETSSSHTYSLGDMQRKSIIDAISLTVTPNRWRVVVVDRASLKIISNALKMHAILEQNVMAVQLITRSRQPYPDMDAIYILVPCADSILRMIDDFSNEADQQDDAQTKYAHAHLFFTGQLSKELFALLTRSRAAPYVKNISEMFVEFNPFESRVFLTTPSEQPFYSLYSPNAADAITKDLDAASDRLLSVIATLGIQPFIRYYSPEANSKSSNPSPVGDSVPRIARAMADRLQLKLDEFYSVGQHAYAEDKTGSQSKQSGPPSVILVLDRSIDMYAPLIHEMSYQAMVYDLVGLDEGDKHTYTIESNDGQTHQHEAKLSEKTDPLWEKLRHEHIGNVADILATRLERFAEESAGVSSFSSDGKKLTLEEMKRFLADLPDFKKKQSLYSAHTDLVTKCMEVFDQRNLSAVVEFEQELVTQLSSEGEPVGRMSLETRLVALLDDHDLEYKWVTSSQPSTDKQKSWFVPAVQNIISSVYAHQKGTLIIYIAGGMTFSEMRSVYEMARKYRRQIYIGSTHIITPGGFLNDLKSLHLKMLM